MKRCSGPLCKGELKPLSAFGPHGRGLQSYCRGCNNSGSRQSSRTDPVMPIVPIVELEPDLELDRREASAEAEEPPRKRRRPDSSDT